jgi:hypothetical protein
LDVQIPESRTGILMTKSNPKRGSPIAVLTGDLVRSSSLTPHELARARAAVHHAGDDIAPWSPNGVLAPVEFFRGDAWQVAIAEPRFFLRAAIYVRARLRSENQQFDSRIGVGLGNFDQIDAKRTSLSTGDAFTISGRMLDALAGAAGIGVGLAPPLDRRVGWTQPLCGLCSAVVNHWTERQAELVCRMLGPRKVAQIELAEQLDIAKQTVSKALAAADFAPLSAAIQFVEKVNWAMEASRKGVRFVKI